MHSFSLFAGIYVGGNKVVHFTCEKDLDKSGGFIASSYSPSKVSLLDFSSFYSNKLPACLNIPDCGYKKPGSGVVLSCLDCFLGRDSVYRFEYGISGVGFVMKLRGGTCTTAKSDAPKEVIGRAMYLLHNGYGNYDVFQNNCEDFALYCKTGLLIHDQDSPGRSGQVYGGLGAPVAAVLSTSLRLFMSNPIGLAAAGVSMYCLSRYATDIGVRNDVIKVEVEDIVLFRGSEGKPTKINKPDGESVSLNQTDIPAPKRQRSS